MTLGVLAARLVLLPALLTALVTAALALRLFASPDPMFLLTLLMSNATPTAINIQVRARPPGCCCSWAEPCGLDCGLPTSRPAARASPPRGSLRSRPPPCPAPPQNMAVLYGTGEAEVSTILFLQYLASIATLPAWVTLFQRIILTWG